MVVKSKRDAWRIAELIFPGESYRSKTMTKNSNILNPESVILVSGLR